MVRDPPRPAGWRAELTTATGAALAVTAAALHPLLAPGAVLNLDLVIVDRRPVGPGVWGLGTELPRMVPLDLVLGSVSAVIGGGATGRLLLAGTMMLALVGMYRTVRLQGVGRTPAAGAALLFGLNPWLLTRLSVGHSAIALAGALLPWVVPALLTPSLGRRFALAAGTMAMVGYSGGLLGAVIVVSGAVAGRIRWRAVAVYGAVQVTWVVPGAIVMAQQVDPVGSAGFPSGVDGPADAVGLFAGFGFWQDSLQFAAGAGALSLVTGLALIAAASVGMGVPHPERRSLLVASGVVVGLVLVDSVPVLRPLLDTVSGSGPAGVVREPQRFAVIALYLVHTSAARGIERLEPVVARWLRPTVSAWPVVGAAALAVAGMPALWRAIEPVGVPPEWAEARSVIDAEPGPVLVLPWYRYLDLALVDGRRALNPLPAYLTGDVVWSGDLGLGAGGTDSGDPRSRFVDQLMPDLRAGRAGSPELADLGVRWVLVLHELDYGPLLGLLDDPGLDHRIAAPGLDLLAVRAWPGPAVDPVTGDPVPVRTVVPPLARIDHDGPVVWNVPYAPGWMRGLHPAGPAPVTGIALPATDSSLVWNAPALLALAAHVQAAALVLSFALRSPYDTCHDAPELICTPSTKGRSRMRVLRRMAPLVPLLLLVGLATAGIANALQGEDESDIGPQMGDFTDESGVPNVSGYFAAASRWVTAPYIGAGEDLEIRVFGCTESEPLLVELVPRKLTAEELAAQESLAAEAKLLEEPSVLVEGDATAEPAVHQVAMPATAPHGFGRLRVTCTDVSDDKPATWESVIHLVDRAGHEASMAELDENDREEVVATVDAGDVPLATEVITSYAD